MRQLCAGTPLPSCQQGQIAEIGQSRHSVPCAYFTDAAESATTLHRPGLKALLAAVAAVAARGIDIVYADAMDRLSRSQADIAMLFERLRFRGIVLATRKEGQVTPLHIGMMGTINAEQLSATSEKTRDALVRRHATGRNPEGSAHDRRTWPFRRNRWR